MKKTIHVIRFIFLIFTYHKDLFLVIHYFKIFVFFLEPMWYILLGPIGLNIEKQENV